MPKPKDLGNDISLIDVLDLGMKQRTGTYVFHEDELTIVETSASPSIPFLLAGLEELSVNPEQIKYIIVTHIHLDHAGGVGLLLEKCPNASVVVHPRGKRHLADPTKLILGARAVYGDQFDQLFNPILPVPVERLITMDDGQSLRIGNNRTLTFMDTPGHSKHHMTIHDSMSNGVFTGDTIGVFYPHTKKYGFELVLPSTSPNQFNPDDMITSLERIEKLEVDSIYFGHYGKSELVNEAFNQIRYWLPKFVAIGEQVLKANGGDSFEIQVKKVTTALGNMIHKFLENKGVKTNDEVFDYIDVDMQICAMGIVDYLIKSK